MSSDLKDARWQLAIETAEQDGADFFALDYGTKEMYLAAAQLYLGGGASRDEIAELAAKFREEPVEATYDDIGGL